MGNNFNAHRLYYNDTDSIDSNITGDSQNSRNFIVCGDNVFVKNQPLSAFKDIKTFNQEHCAHVNSRTGEKNLT